jgi:hypothetical protein
LHRKSRGVYPTFLTITVLTLLGFRTIGLQKQ